MLLLTVVCVHVLTVIRVHVIMLMCSHNSMVRTKTTTRVHGDKPGMCVLLFVFFVRVYAHSNIIVVPQDFLLFLIQLVVQLL